jgi:AhpC/TSA antioxidant enzyme
LREHEAEFTDKGARIAAIGLGDRNYGHLFREETGITFPLLIDEERLAYRMAGLGSANVFHIFRADNMAHRKKAKRDGHRQHVDNLGQVIGMLDPDKNPFQLGGSFVFSPDNRDLYAHVSKTFGDNAPIADLLAAITP